MSDTRKERRAKLVAALRSGDYPQTTSVLTRVDLETKKITGHCCLGVACELVQPWDRTTTYGGLATYGEPKPYPFYDNEKLEIVEGSLKRLPYGMATAVLPETIVEYYGFSNEVGSFYINDKLSKQFPKFDKLKETNSVYHECSLTDLNDDYGWTFAEIADLIEAEPKGLFVDE